MSLEVRVKEEPVWDSDAESHEAQGDPLANNEAESELGDADAQETPQRFQSYAASNLAVEVELIKVEVEFDHEAMDEAPGQSECAGLQPPPFALHASQQAGAAGPLAPWRSGKPRLANFARPNQKGIKNYVCDTCGKTFRDKHDLIDHIKLHSDKAELIKSPLEIDKHYRGKGPFKCEICNKDFTKLCVLKVHTLSHTGEKHYACDICNKVFSRSDNLRMHKRLHTEYKLYTCAICNKSFTLLRYLRGHEKIHTDDSVYTCIVCHKTYTTYSSLKRHKRLHTGEKPFSCNICKKEFMLSSGLKSHAQTHTNEKLYSCDVCDKKFKQSCVLQRHKLVHTGERRYSCGLCEKRFTRLTYLKKHARVHAGENIIGDFVNV